jgi:hypothetical protein
MESNNNEFEGGTIDRKCPKCGQFCKIPHYYIGSHKGSYAKNYCNRCKKEIKLSVEYI